MHAIALACIVAAVIFGTAAVANYVHMRQSQFPVDGLTVYSTAIGAMWALAFVLLAAGSELAIRVNHTLRTIAVPLVALSLIFLSMPWWPLEWAGVFVKLLRSTL